MKDDRLFIGLRSKFTFYRRDSNLHVNKAMNGDETKKIGNHDFEFSVFA